MKTTIFLFAFITLLFGCTSEPEPQRPEGEFTRVSLSKVSFEIPSDYEANEDAQREGGFDYLIDSSFQVRGRFNTLPSEQLSRGAIPLDLAKAQFSEQYDRLTMGLSPENMGEEKILEGKGFTLISRTYFNPEVFEEGLDVNYVVILAKDEKYEMLIKGKNQFKERNQIWGNWLVESLKVN